MSSHYDHKSIENKWKENWQEHGLFQNQYYTSTETNTVNKENKYYILPQLPYPSGAGLHMGHSEGYTACDIFARYKRMKGKKVMQVIGWDAFGLPAENYAIKTNIHPRINTDKAIENFISQINALGLSVDWTRTVGSHNPDYYKWTQWFFQLMYDRGLAYRKKQEVNWCESCKTVLANEQVIEGKCERCETEVDHRQMEQWFLKITDYADRLHNDLDKIDWPEETVKRQRDWIGRKEGINITYNIEGIEDTVTVFTTRPDTNFGATFIVLGPEHLLAQKIIMGELVSPNTEEIKKYAVEARKKTEIERNAEGRKKTGVFTGYYALNQLNNTKIPIWISDFVIGSFGTGALVGVPGHDQRDFEFAKEFNLPIIRVVIGKDGDKSPINDIMQVQEDEGTMINSGFLDGMDIHTATIKMMDYLEEKGWGKRVVNYKLRDWSVSRQRFWGAPIPMILNKEVEIPSEYNHKPDFVLNLHAWYSSPEEHYHKWLDTELKKMEIQASTPVLPGGIKPSSSEWLTVATREFDKNTSDNKVVTARSLSCRTTLKLAEARKMRKLILVCPAMPISEYNENIMGLKFLEPEAKDAILNFGETKIDYNKVQQNVEEIVVFLSTDDPYVPLKPTEKYIRENLPFARIIRMRNAGHFNLDAGYSKFETLVREIIKSVNPKIKKVDLKDLPVILPDDVDFMPTGQSPLTYSESFQKGVVEKYGEGWAREVDTLDTFMCSSWYYYRYLDPTNNNEFVSEDILKKWMPVDFYIGGPEHVNGHLLYSRFFTKVLYDAGYIDFDEPFIFHRHQGLVWGEDRRKMSKRWGNVINPTDIVNDYGGDTARTYMMFMGPLEQDKFWDTNGVKGVRRFYSRLWALYNDDAKVNASETSETVKVVLHKTIKKVGEDIEKLKFNTAIAKFMEFLNLMEKDGNAMCKDDAIVFLKILAPFGPFISEELFQMMNNKESVVSVGVNENGKFSSNEFNSIHIQSWPGYDENLAKDDVIDIAVQVNGKVRVVLKNVSVDDTKDVILANAKKEASKYLEGKSIRTEVYVPGKIVNIVLE